MLVVALTGGIGCGKSRVTELFTQRHQTPVIDADLIARELVEPGQPALDAIVREFGKQLLTPEGRLDRPALRDRVFADPEQRRRLEAILHPRIRAAMKQRLAELSAPYALLAIPLLLESGQQELGDRILVVDAPEDIQIQRVMARDGVDAAHVKRIIAAQASRRERLAAADDLIDNSGPPEQLPPQVDRLHALYLDLAGQSGD